MAVVQELIRTEDNGTISFGDYELNQKSKLSDYQYQGDMYKVKTYKEITKLERNGMFVYESVPGTSVFHLEQDGTTMSFEVQGFEDSQITVELEAETEYQVFIDGASTGTMTTNLGGKLSFSVELDTNTKASKNRKMLKNKKTVYFCQECGYESAKWMGQCPACKAWNTFVEETVSSKKSASSNAKISQKKTEPVILRDISLSADERQSCGIGELDRVLGGGIVHGSLVLVGGDPGIGKSTLLLQVCRNLSSQGVSVLYISGEESLRQIKLRADRLGSFNDKLKLLCETNLENIREIIERTKPDVAVVDSIQTMFHEDITSAPGSVSQVRESTNVLMQIAKGMGVSIFIVGHVTKEGNVAGPRVLEHMVDTVLYFEGDRHASYRILRAVKNRFGSTNEIGVFEMQNTGLEEVRNPSEFLLNGRPENASGSVVACSMEGTRPILVEIQALVCQSNFGIPRRTAVGTDFNRVNLLMAVLEKKAGIHLAASDAYVNIAGGMKMTEPAIDLGICLAIISSAKDIVIPDSVMVFGEIGLSGEVRAVSMAGQRVQEAKKLGFETVILPEVNRAATESIRGIQLVYVAGIRDAISYIMR